jgi:flagellar assembly protein FliH
MATLQEAFQQVVDRKRVIIHLHPMDYQYLLDHPEGFPFLHAEDKGVKVIEDSTITRGGCFLETSFGEINATIESQFDEIVSLIWKRFELSRPLSDRSKT